MANRIRLLKFTDSKQEPFTYYLPADRVGAVVQDTDGSLSVLVDMHGMHRIPISGTDVEDVCLRIWGETAPDLPPVGDAPDKKPAAVFHEKPHRIQ